MDPNHAGQRDMSFLDPDLSDTVVAAHEGDGRTSSQHPWHPHDQQSREIGSLHPIPFPTTADATTMSYHASAHPPSVEATFQPDSDVFHPHQFDDAAFLPAMIDDHLDNMDFTHHMMGPSCWADPFDQYPPQPPCDDCPTDNTTNIPHHHHKTGRLAGASAQLAGHFCCSWLLNGDQPCFLCFNNAEALDNHIKADHAGKDGTYRCLWKDCSKIDKTTGIVQPVNFGNKPKLMRHVHSHTGFKPFPCHFVGCEKGFVTKEQLRNHETTHTKSRKYQCDQCGKAFAVKSALTTHITAVHEERKTHKCDMCGKAFADSSNLSKHKQTHYKSHGVTKRRSSSKREVSNVTSARTTPSISTPTPAPVTPNMHFTHSRKPSFPYISHFDMLSSSSLSRLTPMTPMHRKDSSASSLTSRPLPLSGMSIRSSPVIDAFDPDCYCCEQNCPPPEICCDADCTIPGGSPTPCNATDACDAATFCDRPGCLDVADHVSTSMTCASPLSFPNMPPPPMRGAVCYDYDSDNGHADIGGECLSQSDIHLLKTFQLPEGWNDSTEIGHHLYPPSQPQGGGSNCLMDHLNPHSHPPFKAEPSPPADSSSTKPYCHHISTIPKNTSHPHHTSSLAPTSAPGLKIASDPPIPSSSSNKPPEVSGFTDGI